ncbi:MAG: hypothetical protein JW959_02880 [Pirellulales bacterium]|nr:hypothetical protein [Pirellulales bacterium]
MSRRQSIIEIALIFAVFAVQGGWPLPDNNEAYYLGKAIHYWNPDWHAGDFFLETADAHQVFYFTFGWLSLWLTPTALAYAGRAICWLLLAWGWRRLSFAAVPRAWTAVLTAALFVCLRERFNMAGEWVVGGVEAKPFAYALVFFSLAEMLRNRWNRGLLLLGAAAAFHPLVGGWSALAAGFAWLRIRVNAGVGVAVQLPPQQSELPPQQSLDATDGRGFMVPTLRSLWPGIVGGLLISLPGVIPSLMLDWGIDRETARAAHLIYVFERLPHHLVLSGMYTEYILRMDLLLCFWLLLGIWRKRINLSDDYRGPLDVLRGFVAGAVAIAMIGAAIHVLVLFDEGLAAGLLRFYWFRLVDAALPLGVVIESASIIAGLSAAQPPSAVNDEGDNQNQQRSRGRPCYVSRVGLALAIVVAAFHLGDRAVERIAPDAPRTHKLPGNKDPIGRRRDFDDWRAACEWIAGSGEIPPEAVFLTPRLTRTFRWYAGRSDAVSWKDVPQAAGDVVEWWRRVMDIYGTGLPLRSQRWHEPLAEAGEDHLRRLGEKYAADYAITDRTTPPLDLPVVYFNRTYIIYRLR